MTQNNFLTPLIVKKLLSNRWEIQEAFIYRLGSPYGIGFVEVPAGFVTDFASIPRLFWVIWRSPGANYDKPAVIHDWLYQTPYVKSDVHSVIRQHRIGRKEADDIFLEAMRVPELKVRWLTQRALYTAVRLGGWRPWGKYRTQEERLID